MSFKDTFKKAGTVKKVGIGTGVVVGALFLPHVALIAAAGGAAYAGKAIYDKKNQPK